MCFVIVETVEALSPWVGLSLEVLQLRLKHRTRHLKHSSRGHMPGEQAEFLLFTFTSHVFSEKATAPHSSTLAWEIPWTEEPGRLQSMGLRRVRQTERLHFHFSLSCIGEGNGSPLQCSCLENPRDGGAWWAAIYGV